MQVTALSAYFFGALLDQLVTGPLAAESVDAVMRIFKKAILERALGAEMTILLASLRLRYGSRQFVYLGSGMEGKGKIRLHW
jgi:hypothetical protein